MSSFSHYTFQKAVYQMLTGDSTLMNLVTGIFDRPVQDTVFPYITLGESTVNDWSSKTTIGTEHMFMLHIWSREGGRKQAALIMERLHTLLHQASPTVEGQTLVMLRFMASSITLENDGWTYQGMMRFHALLQAA